MNAILGIWNKNGQPVDPTLVERAMGVLAHRGPDRRAIWIDGAVSLSRSTQSDGSADEGNRMLARCTATGLTLAFDGRIDNREALLGVLIDGGRRVQRPVSDEELVLKAYRRWGEGFAERLFGDFALAIWDSTRRRMICARDAMGVRPFYFYEANGCFAFASEIKALLKLPTAPRKLNEARVADHLAGVYEDWSATFFEGIQRLPPSTLMTVTPTECEQRCYWNPDTANELHLRSDDEYAEAFRDLFAEAVRCRLRGSDPIGSMLSGGLDSSSIACMARDQLKGAGRGPLHTFSAIFPSLPQEDLRKIDEREWIDAVVESGGIEAHRLRADRCSPWEDLDSIMAHEDEPFFGPNLYMHWGLHRLAKQHGVRILLDGIDGDSTVSHGFEFLADLARRGRWGRMTREARALARRYNGGSSTWKIVWQCGLKPLAPTAAADLWKRAHGRDIGVDAAGAMVEPAFGRRIGLRERWMQLHRDENRGSFREQHLRSLRSVVMMDVLELTDRSAAAWGIEPRFPFFDRRLIEFCLSLPFEQKLGQGWTRLVMRRAMKGVLPEKVRWRVMKSNLSPNFLRMLKTRDLPAMNLNGNTRKWKIWEYVNRSVFDAALERSKTGEPLRHEDAYLIHKAMIFNRWLERTF
jgi:asparagine synthase (glutamine-hydrolysing)